MEAYSCIRAYKGQVQTCINYKLIEIIIINYHSLAANHFAATTTRMLAVFNHSSHPGVSIQSQRKASFLFTINNFWLQVSHHMENTSLLSDVLPTRVKAPKVNCQINIILFQISFLLVCPDRNVVHKSNK